jgi:protein-S-isoprenylcysteine O-methyltransferase Ste14
VARLLLQSLLSFLVGVVSLGAVLFLSAGTLHYWQAWVFVVVFSASANGIGIYLALKEPALLERRKKIRPAGGSSPGQKVMGVLILVGVLLLLIVPGLDRRFGWSVMPGYVSVPGDLVVVASFVGHYFVFRANRFGGTTVEVFEGQQVISIGPYAVVRHPMYAWVLVMCFGAELALGSWWGLLVIVAMQVPVLAWRILDEERLLQRDLPGYGDYMRKVRYRLVPHVW